MWKQRLLNTQFGVLFLGVSLRITNGTVIQGANSKTINGKMITNMRKTG